ncbi:homoserine kinase [Desulfallas thermosapovorans]|uniref:Homoserine kinase n=1 Tax=Desulfallas thermosapovorans DSM 6562 TaxID=1121431 RepID=A0A5S4ZS27_9FIRM|nr:homoserine kinase [Desulfallas thermosapovorans]TYO95549.1 homoserine kinase [Desulfallas thermosapovorans DSM 6562]
MIRVQVPATTANLGPGFDCLGMALELYNIVEFSKITRGLVVEVEGEGAGNLPCNESNLVYRAAKRVFDRAGYAPAGLRIRLINGIPVGRGLGSSAAAVIGGIIAANRLCGAGLGTREMLTLACSMEGHPDNIAPALLGGLVIYASVDGEITWTKIDLPPGIKAVVAVPDFVMNTRDTREALPQLVTMRDAVFNISRAALLVAALQKGDLSVLGTAMDDRLHQPFRSGLIPGFKKVVSAARLAGARGVALSGAGPTIVALADDNQALIAEVMKETFRESGVNARSLILAPSPVGARALEVI